MDPAGQVERVAPAYWFNPAGIPAQPRQLKRGRPAPLCGPVSFGLHGQALIEDGRISYLDDESRQAALFKDGLAIVANDKLRIYDSTGLEFFSTSAVMLNPVLQTTPKQVLVFDRGDGSLQVYNSFDQVFALELEEPIINASLNDSGALIVAHKAEGYKSQLTLYDTGFNERYKWYSAGSYLLDVDVYGNCKQFAAGGYYPGRVAGAVRNSFV